MNTAEKIMQIDRGKVFSSYGLVVRAINQNVLNCQQAMASRTVRAILLFQQVRMYEESMTNTSSMKNNLIPSNGHIFTFSFTYSRLNHLKFIELNLSTMILPNSGEVIIIIIFIMIVLRPFFHTRARVRRYQQLNYSIPTYSAHLPFLVQTFSCLLSHPQSMFSYPFPSLCHLPPPDFCIWKSNHQPLYVPH